MNTSDIMKLADDFAAATSNYYLAGERDAIKWQLMVDARAALEAALTEKQEKVTLTDEQIKLLWVEYEILDGGEVDFARAIEAAVCNELRAKLKQQSELVEKCMAAMNENADRGEAAEAELATLKEAKQEPVAEQTVTQLRVKRNDLQRLVENIKLAVHEMDGLISVTEAVGALELAKMEILEEQK